MDSKCLPRYSRNLSLKLIVFAFYLVKCLVKPTIVFIKDYFWVDLENPLQPGVLVQGDHFCHAFLTEDSHSQW